MYDFANSAYTTVVITAVFSAYFVGVVAENKPWATFAWTAALSVSYAAILFTGRSSGRGPMRTRRRSRCSSPRPSAA